MLNIHGTISQSASINGTVSQSTGINGLVYGTFANMSNNHSVLLNRDERDSHPMHAITGLEDYLSGIDESMQKLIDDWSMDENGYLYLKAEIPQLLDQSARSNHHPEDQAEAPEGIHIPSRL